MNLIAIFIDDLWKYITNTTDFTQEFNDSKMPNLQQALNSNIEGRGTYNTLTIMRDACTPKEWLVTFLTVRKEYVTEVERIDFIDTVLNKLDTIYVLLCSVVNHYRFEKHVCMSSLLMQLESSCS
jgi:hypothetical protein